jgi:hypothetical protein
MPNDEVFNQGRLARGEGRSPKTNPWFGGGKTEAANQLKWEMGWKVDDAQAPRQKSVPKIECHEVQGAF